MSQKRYRCDCGRRLKIAHKHFNCALKMFDSADRMFDTSFNRKIDQALCEIKQINECDRKGLATESAGFEISKPCRSQRASDCQYLFDKAIDAYEKEVAIKKDIEQCLKDIQCKIALAQECDQTGDRYYKEYLDCVHKYLR